MNKTINLKNTPFKITSRSNIITCIPQGNIKPSLQSASLFTAFYLYDKASYHMIALVIICMNWLLLKASLIVGKDCLLSSFEYVQICCGAHGKSSCKRSEVFALRSSAACIIYLQHFHLPNT